MTRGDDDQEATEGKRWEKEPKKTGATPPCSSTGEAAGGRGEGAAGGGGGGRGGSSNPSHPSSLMTHAFSHPSGAQYS